MKTYNDYMDTITVSDTLHRRLVSCAAAERPPRRLFRLKHYAAAAVCLAVILLGAAAVFQAQPPNTAPLPGNQAPLIFNKAGAITAANIAIPGHFWHDLTPAELAAVFPALPESYEVTATANSRGDGTLFNIDAQVLNASGAKTYIQIAPDKVALDYVLDGEVKASSVLGTAVTAGYFETKPNSRGQLNVIYFTKFGLSGLDYYVELGGAADKKEELQQELTTLIDLLISGGAADLSPFANPTIPELREDRLDLSQARADTDFGLYLPTAVPAGFHFEEALRFINQERNELSALWRKGMGHISWRIAKLNATDTARITPVSDTQNYDLSLYPIPRAESVPDGLREIVDNPIFRSEELMLEAVRARAYEVVDAGDEPGERMRFGVLYGDILVEINVKGATPEAIYKILQQIAH